MRDAFGGAFMLRVFFVFLIVYVCFISVALNYARAFKVKNMVISYLEDNEITDIENLTASEEEELLNFFDREIVENLKYVSKGTSCQNFEAMETGRCYLNYGITIKQYNSIHSNKLGVYYEVSVNVGYDIGFLKILMDSNGSDRGTWRIKGETRLIVSE